MKSQEDNTPITKRKFQLHEHPWLSLVAVAITIVVSIILATTLLYAIGLSPFMTSGQVTHDIVFQLLTVFLFVPFVLHLPKGKRTYRQYLDDIGLTRVQPFIRLVLLGLSCYIILALSQAAASFVYRISEGLPLTWNFVRQVFDLSGDLPPGSPGLLVSFPSIFEEAVFRGIVLTVFLGKVSERKAIIFSSLGFGLMHLLNLAGGRELVWVLGQSVGRSSSACSTDTYSPGRAAFSPPMIVHYLGNVFIGSLTGYMQSRASIEMQVCMG